MEETEKPSYFGYGSAWRKRREMMEYNLGIKARDFRVTFASGVSDMPLPAERDDSPLPNEDHA